MAAYVTVLDLNEISGLRVECHQCHAALSLPLVSERSDRLPDYCPVYRADWTAFTGTEPVQVLQQLLVAIRYRGLTSSLPLRCGLR